MDIDKRFNSYAFLCVVSLAGAPCSHKLPIFIAVFSTLREITLYCHFHGLEWIGHYNANIPFTFKGVVLFT